MITLPILLFYTIGADAILSPTHFAFPRNLKPADTLEILA